MNELLAALVLGIVEGVTEFVPVSSTGHLIIAAKLLAFEGDVAETFEIFIQSGAILAAVILYWHRFAGLLDIRNGIGHFLRFDNSSFRGGSGVLKLGVCSFPALALGALFHHAIKERLFNPTSVALALITGGAILVLLDRKERSSDVHTVDQISLKQCLMIGCFQCLSLWPGMSRAASTIIGGMLSGLDRRVSAEFSFFAAVPVILAATLYDLYKSWTLLSADVAPIFAVGFIVSFLTAMGAIRLFVAALSCMTLQPFGYYRIALGILVLAVLRG